MRKTKRNHFFVVLIAMAVSVGAKSQRSVDGIINAEKKFAAYSVEHSTKEAFLKFLDSSAVLFVDHKPVNAIQQLMKQRSGGVLTWRVQYAEMAGSGDIGYASGAWVRYANNLQERPAGKGQYLTIWRFNRQGEWKAVLDMGVSYNDTNMFNGIKKIKAATVQNKNAGNDALQKAEQSFIEMYGREGAAAYDKLLSEESILLRKDILPAVTAKQRRQVISTVKPGFVFTVDAVVTAAGNNFGYVYGTCRKDDAVVDYVRIWRKEKAGWRIAFEIL